MKDYLMHEQFLINALRLFVISSWDVMSTSKLYNIKNGYARAAAYKVTHDFLIPDLE